MTKKIFGTMAIALLLAGCGTIESAREAQQAVAPKGGDQYLPPVPTSFSFRADRLEDYVNYAISNRPAMIQAKLALDDARLQLLQIDQNAPLISETPWYAPQAGLTAGYGRNSPQANALHWTTSGNASFNLSLDVLVYDFGRNAAQGRAQAERVVKAEETLINTGYVIFDDVAEAYSTYLKSSAQYEIAATNALAYQVHVERAKQLLQAGEGQPLDVLKAQKDFADAQEKTVVKRNARTIAAASFLKSLGLDAARVKFEDVFSVSNALLVVQGSFGPSKITAEEAFALARTNSPAMRVARAELRAASKDVDAAIADYYPNVNASVSVNWADPYWYWNWAANMTQDLLFWYRKNPALDRATVALRTAESKLDDAAIDLAHQIKDAIAARDDAREQSESARVTYEAALENYRMVVKQYEVGEANRFDFADAASSLVTALGTRIDAFYSEQMAEAYIFQLMGVKPVYDYKTIPFPLELTEEEK